MHLNNRMHNYHQNSGINTRDCLKYIDIKQQYLVSVCLRTVLVLINKTISYSGKPFLRLFYIFRDSFTLTIKFVL
jgi:hypothetical protein